MPGIRPQHRPGFTPAAGLVVSKTGVRRPVVELSECILCEVCTSVCPRVFQINEAGFVAVQDLPEYPEADVNEAVKNCPQQCIYWE